MLSMPLAILSGSVTILEDRTDVGVALLQTNKVTLLPHTCKDNPSFLCHQQCRGIPIGLEVLLINTVFVDAV